MKIFFISRKVLGGTERLFTNYHDALKSRQIESKIIYIEDLLVDLSSFSDLTEDDVLILSSKELHILSSVNKKYLKVIVIQLHPYELISAYVRGISLICGFASLFSLNGHIILKWMLLGQGKKVHSFIERKGLYFMDLSCSSVSSEVFDLKPNYDWYLPVFSRYEPKLNKHKVGASINFLTVSRFDGFKTEAIMNTLHELNKLGRTLKSVLVFHLVGYGNTTREIYNYSLHYCPYVNLKISPPADIPEIVENFCDTKTIYVGMGTSLLDLASYCLPSLCCNPSFSGQSFSRRYQWLFELKGHSLGQYIGPKNSSSCFNLSDLDIMSIDFDKFRLKSLEHVVEYHLAEGCIDRFVKACSATELRIGVIS